MTTMEIILFIEACILGITAFIYALKWGKQIDYTDMLIDKYNELVGEYSQLVRDKNRIHHIGRLLLFLYHKHREKHNRGTRKCKELSSRIKVLESQLLPDTERILCAAIWYDDGIVHDSLPRNIESGIVISSYRHAYCFAILHELFPERDYIIQNRYSDKTIQGFLTSANNFVDREQAGRIAYNAGQIKDEIDMLFSEDLY